VLARRQATGAGQGVQGVVCITAAAQGAVTGVAWGYSKEWQEACPPLQSRGLQRAAVVLRRFAGAQWRDPAIFWRFYHGFWRAAAAAGRKKPALGRFLLQQGLISY
jgi:hypothetical protein